MRSSITRALHVPRRSLGLFPAGLGGRYYQHVSSSQYRGGFSSNIAQRSIPRPRFFQTNSAAVGSTHVASESTVYALSTAPGRAGIAVIRISGPACIEVCNSSITRIVALLLNSCAVCRYIKLCVQDESCRSHVMLASELSTSLMSRQPRIQSSTQVP